MNTTESLALTRFVKAACPQQKFDEYTPDAWHELLADLNFADCRTAVTTLAKQQPFVAPSEIREEVKRIRNDRLRRFGNADPVYDGDDVIGGLEAIRAQRKAIADGRVEPHREISDGPRRADVEKLVKRTAARMPKIPKSVS